MSMSTASSPAPGSAASPSPARVAFASFIGTTVEWYDYFLFGTAAVLIFNRQFFPTLSPVAGTLASLATFAVAFVARPLGGAVFGHFGDRMSRKSMLVWSLLLMGASTFLIGLLPTYAQIGVWAPVLLVLLRLVQGFAVGGEWGGAVLMALEHAPRAKRSFYASWPQAGVPAGVVLSSGAFFLVQQMPEADLEAWGWRLPFLMSAVLIAIGLFIRMRITESPEFLKMKDRGSDVVVPGLALLREHKREVLIDILSLTGSNTLFYIATVYLLSYGQTVGLTRGNVLLAIAFAAVLDVIAIPVAAVFADRHGKRALLVFGSLVTAACAFPIFWLVNTGTVWGAVGALVIALPIAHSFVYATISGFIAGLFAPHVRFTGSSMSYQLGGVVSSAPAPFVATALFEGYGTYVAIAIYLIAANLVSLVAVLCARRDQHEANEHETHEGIEHADGVRRAGDREGAR